MERADLLYADLLNEGLVITALALSLWTAGLLTAAFCFFNPQWRSRLFRPSQRRH